ncbi:hypothetical protein BJV74DRAFT_799128 [Russula compacta]|nr:hypothetical protein BJV74DRAFT_799128 [Russula compacta]
MKALRQLLSDSLAVFLRLSACNTTSSHIPAPIEKSSHQQSSDHLSDQQSPASANDFSAATMSLQPDIITPSSYLQSVFNLTLVEYSKQTGIDLITHSFAAGLDDIYSVDRVITTLRERTGASNMGDPIAQLVGQLKSIVHIVSLLSPSEALSENIDPRFSPVKAVFTGIAVLLAVANDSGANYDAILDLFDSIESSLKFLRISVEIPSHLIVIQKAMKILFQLILVLAVATKQAKRGRTQKVKEKLLKEGDIGHVLRRLNRLTQDETQKAVLPNMEVVYGLITNIKVVMDGGKASMDEIQPALGVFDINAVFYIP